MPQMPCGWGEEGAAREEASQHAASGRIAAQHAACTVPHKSWTGLKLTQMEQHCLGSGQGCSCSAALRGRHQSTAAAGGTKATRHTSTTTAAAARCRARRSRRMPAALVCRMAGLLRHKISRWALPAAVGTSAAAAAAPAASDAQLLDASCRRTPATQQGTRRFVQGGRGRRVPNCSPP